MKLSALLIAASVVVGALGATAASADRGYHRHGARDHHRHCRTEWRHHHRVTRCY